MDGSRFFTMVDITFDGLKYANVESDRVDGFSQNFVEILYYPIILCHSSCKKSVRQKVYFMRSKMQNIVFLCFETLTM